MINDWQKCTLTGPELSKSVLSDHNDMNGMLCRRGVAVMWENECNCLSISVESVISQRLKSWLALSRF